MTTQLELFPASGIVHALHVVEVTRHYVIQELGRDVHGTHTWYAWRCSCGDTSLPRAQWSHQEMAGRMWEAHAAALVT